MRRKWFLGVLALMVFGGCHDKGTQVGLYKLPSGDWAGESTALVSKVNLPQSPDELPPYRLHNGDKLRISLASDEKLKREVIVDPNGYFNFPFAGSVKALGKTREEVGTLIEQKLSAFYDSPSVNVEGVEFKGNFVTVVGAVKKPGTIELTAPTRLFQVIGLAEGLSLGERNQTTVPLAALESAHITRNGKRLPVNFTQMYNSGGQVDNVYVQPGDFIFIPFNWDKKIYVLGHVQFSKAIAFSNKITIIDAITEAGGFQPQAMESAVLLVRNRNGITKTRTVSFHDVRVGQEPNWELKKGDIVYIPKTATRLVEEFIEEVLPFLDNVIQSDSAYRAGFGKPAPK